MAGQHILVVEDHVDTLDVLSRLLRSLGYVVKDVCTVRDALEHASANAIDLLISDLTLPDGNGADLAREICSGRKIPSIALSGYAPGEGGNPSAESEFTARLVKPIDFQLLQETIRKVLPDQA